MHNLDRVGHVVEQTSIDTSAYSENFNDSTISEALASEQHLADQRVERLQSLHEAGVRIMDTRSQIRPIPEDERPDYMTFPYLCKIADALPDHHRIEMFAAAALQELGLQARALSPVVDGDVSNKKADIIINLPWSEQAQSWGCTPKQPSPDAEPIAQVAIEVKRANGRFAKLGLPLFDNDEFATEGFESYPKWLYVDSVSAWKAKQQWHERRGVPILGAIVACNIVELSDEDISVLGLLYLPCNGTWVKKDTCNPSKGTHYTAWTARGKDNILPLRALADQLASA